MKNDIEERRRRKLARFETAIKRAARPVVPATKRTPKWKRRKLTAKRLEKIIHAPGRYGDEQATLQP